MALNGKHGANNDNDDDDDYLSMTFPDATPAKETSLQRTTRLRNERRARGHVPSKAERAAQAQADLAAAVGGGRCPIDTSNSKGARMLAKMGFKEGGALGKAGDGRTQPIPVELKDGRGGLGLQAERKRKWADAADAAQKREKLSAEEFRERTRAETEAKQAEGKMWSAMKTLATLEEEEKEEEEEEEAERSGGEDGAGRVKRQNAKPAPLRSVNVLYRPLIKQRLENQHDARLRTEMGRNLGALSDLRNPDPDTDDDDRLAYDSVVNDDHDEDDPELDEFEALSFVERLDKVVVHLREHYHYCFWCKFRYPDETMDGCPGVTEDEHD